MRTTRDGKGTDRGTRYARLAFLSGALTACTAATVAFTFAATPSDSPTPTPPSTAHSTPAVVTTVQQAPSTSVVPEVVTPEPDMAEGTELEAPVAPEPAAADVDASASFDEANVDQLVDDGAPEPPVRSRKQTGRAPLLVQQGTRFSTRKLGAERAKSACTVGYIDAANRSGYSAAHCGNNGDAVYVKNSKGEWALAGKFQVSSAYDKATNTNDWARIKWNSRVTYGKNGFSGDAIISPDSLDIGDKLCLRGSASHKETANNVSCGRYAGRVRTTVFMDGGGGVQGDSGGAVYAPGKGFVGVYSGHNEHRKVHNGDRRLERVSMIGNGAPVSRAEQRAIAEALTK
ncbi:trypsin-like serine protease [Corynebacterium aquatimens]|uniref:Peptidase S1 domain-containing protein n=1 Tax=Corynebacterium aquatimens TaxID=1190508 RepID=A0A931GQY2_9CORY|nr:trypsin-like serine protease [Corynebacterium aquatimens]MBG6121333.1 hypothetical protein [Corynebacterium aquatimens]WJY66120.1 hypothetical protein CAQUA_07110 [Corynebacterium aquatimens]